MADSKTGVAVVCLSTANGPSVELWQHPLAREMQICVLSQGAKMYAFQFNPSVGRVYACDEPIRDIIGNIGAYKQATALGGVLAPVTRTRFGALSCIAVAVAMLEKASGWTTIFLVREITCARCGGREAIRRDLAGESEWDICPLCSPDKVV